MQLDRSALIAIAAIRARLKAERMADVDAMTAWIAREVGELREETALARKELVLARAELRRWQQIATAKGAARDDDHAVH